MREESSHAFDPEQELHRLDPRVIRVWRITALIRNGIILAAAVAGGTLLHLYEETSLLVVIPAWIFFTVVFLLETGYLPRKRYETTFYRAGDGIFELRSGLVWKTSVMIPISRIQHIDLLRGPLEHHHGLATLNVHTAGTSNASHKVSGLEASTAVAIRERIMAAANLDWKPAVENNERS